MKMVSPVLASNFKNTFMSYQKDQETIWRKLFIENKPHSDMLKRLLVINTKDCLDDSKEQYRRKIDELSLKDLMDQGYLRIVPKITIGEHEEVKSFILLEFDDYVPTENPEFRNCIISFTIISHLDYWQMDDYMLRPQAIAGYIDGILNETKLSGIGTLQFMGASQVVLSEHLGGMLLRYVATHGTDDISKEGE